MFPVKGLSVSAEKLKVETGSVAADAAAAPKPSKKRKRQGNAQNVTAENFADLWQQVIEHNGPKPAGAKSQQKQGNKRQKTEAAPAKQPDSKHETKKSKKDKKKEKKEKRDSLAVADEPAQEDGDEWGGINDELNAPEASRPARKDKADKKEKKNKPGAEPQQTKETKPKAEAAPPSAPAPPATTKLTPLQASMREKLISARFRHLNETLYTRPSAEAFRLFEESPEMFTEYHEGFRRQVDVWPENPVDGYIEDIKARAKVRSPPRNLIAANKAVTPSQLPLPRPGAGPRDPPNPKATCTIADLGCGDAKLATALQPLKQKLRLDLRSFDLQTGGSPLVTRADIANLPLADGSVDVAVFCLALMGTNWTDFVEEAYRVLRWKGELWIAEIKSRFAGAGGSGKTKKKAVVDHSVGNRKKNATPGGKKSKRNNDDDGDDEEYDEEANLAELAVHVDGDVRKGAKDGNETDVSAFVEALRKRGFLLNRDLGDNAVDMSNKMFVKMYFVKAAPAVRGKCAAPEAGGAAGGDGVGKNGMPMKQKKKFIEDDEDDGDDPAKEAKLLKPCVYKIR
ncbi:hypothetical protein VTK26DRAFT_8161 [Humicola hyalothermophila]